MKKISFLLITFLMGSLIAQQAFASATRVGNGDDGNDLEGFKRVHEGILVDTQKEAAALVRRLNLSSISGMGNLLPEVERAKLFIADKNAEAKYAFDKGMESSKDGKYVYARTFAEPYAPTRFFPKSLELSKEQLISLHIHEALHRSLPRKIRENEEIVSHLTLSITSPDATNDRIRKVASKYISDKMILESRFDRKRMGPQRPAQVTYSFKAFQKPDVESSFPIASTHSFESYLYPFGKGENTFGFGAELSYIVLEESSYLGPFAFMGNYLLTELSNFDLEVFGRFSVSTVSDSEVKDSPVGRDVLTLGVSLIRYTETFYFRNQLSYSFGGESEQRFEDEIVNYEFGAVTRASVSAGWYYREFSFGGFAELSLAASYKRSGVTVDDIDTGRYRIVAFGPEFQWYGDDWQVNLFGRWVVDSTESANLDFIGDLMGQGSGQGHVGLSFSLAI